MLPKTPNSTSTKIYVSNPPKPVVKDDHDSSAKESLSEDESETEDPEKLQKLQIRNLKRLREKVKEEEEKLRVLKNSAAKIKDSSHNGKNKSTINQHLNTWWTLYDTILDSLWHYFWHFMTLFWTL